MTDIAATVWRKRRSERGQGAIDYMMIIGLVTLFLITAMYVFRDPLDRMMKRVTGVMSGEKVGANAAGRTPSTGGQSAKGAAAGGKAAGASGPNSDGGGAAGEAGDGGGAEQAGSGGQSSSESQADAAGAEGGDSAEGEDGGKVVAKGGGGSGKSQPCPEGKIWRQDANGRMGCYPVKNAGTGGISIWVFVIVAGVLALIVAYFMSASSR